MEDHNISEYMKDRYFDQINWYDGKAQENWINYRTTCETLRKEKYFYDGGIGEYRSAANAEAIFIERVESVIARENTLWISAQKPESKSE